MSPRVADKARVIVRKHDEQMLVGDGERAEGGGGNEDAYCTYTRMGRTEKTELTTDKFYPKNTL